MAALRDLQVDVGGRMVHVVRAGQGSPAVVLEAGAGCGAELWRAVQEQVGEVTATFSYDRAGHGASDPDGPWSLESWLADRADWVPEILDFSPAELDHCDRAWQRSQRGLATLSANSTFRTAEHSGHLIPAEQPDLVAAEIVAMVAQVNGQL